MTGDAIGRWNVTAGAQGLWREWLTGFFDGQAHTVGGVVRAFPMAEVAFDEGSLAQPLGSGIGITVVGTEAGDGRRYMEGAGGPALDTERRFEPAAWTMYVRAKGSNTGQGNAKYRARQAADLLHGVLVDRASTAMLAQKGMMNLRASKPVVVASNDYAVTTVRVKGELQYQ